VHAAFYIGCGTIIAFAHPPKPALFISQHQHDIIKVIKPILPKLKQKSRFIDAHFISFPGSLPHFLAEQRRQPGMYNCVKLIHPVPAEGLLSQMGPIQRSVSMKCLRSKGTDQFFSHILIAGHQLFGQGISIEHKTTLFGPHLTNGRFSAANAAGNAYFNHYSGFSDEAIDSKYSLIKSSISPSITPSTSEVS